MCMSAITCTSQMNSTMRFEQVKFENVRVDKGKEIATDTDRANIKYNQNEKHCISVLISFGAKF